VDQIEMKTNVLNQSEGKNWSLYHGDSCEIVKGIPDNSVGISIFSPPFSSLYVYSNSERDMGNSRSDAQFMEHFSAFLMPELLRVTIPGRHVVFHCANVPAMNERDGYIGLKHLRGQLIERFIGAGFIFHSEHVIWKDPLIEATRSKSLGLMHKQLMKDSSRCRAGIPDYLIAMRKPGVNPNPVAHEHGLLDFVGDNPPIGGVMSHEIWRRYASPVWMDINQSNTLQKASAREEKDERHICPLQLDVIERALVLWSNSGDVVFSPFAGIGSEGFQAIKMGRKFIGVELKESYYKQARLNLMAAEEQSIELL
jgi:DNA modification methylase